MKKKSNDSIEMHRYVYKLFSGRMQAQALLTGLELGVFDYLSSPQPGEVIAATLRSHPSNTEVLLDSLTSLGLLEKKNGRYCNTQRADELLNSESPSYIGKILLLMHRMSAGVVSDMTRLVQDGPFVDHPEFGNEEIWVDYARAVGNFHRGGTVQHIAGIVSGIEGFSAFGNMLDLGGGPGLHCIGIVSESQSMKGVVFDRPEVLRVAEEFIAEYGMQDRISVKSGDYLTDSIGEGYDLIWASSTLNFARSILDRLMKKIHDALLPGGVFVSLAEGLTDEGTKPDFYVLENLSYALTGFNQVFRKGEIAGAMLRAGFASVDSMTVETPMMPMEMDIARKKT
ncbi:acetylserotonin O-methyltransferase [Prosthecochloris sp. SCSIO W1101]|uniref:methyltransferase n=1 Tax=Prosthecochloris sp. SCSIO W1101 TaxID=2992242 RepID=UPI00223E7051|nr:methyltransferase dimerization domain-containing protein [Prosthecochloris sp. SCSIO W1101]UZJ40728.1 acetylserotonin O-methyltransferase [Prosthecochloris sp. SCSIO W1101]